MFLGINVFWVHLRSHFNPCLTALPKMSLNRAQNIYLLANMNSWVQLITHSSSSLRPRVWVEEPEGTHSGV